MELNQISGQIVDAAMRVHSALGPGLLESAYEQCLIIELRERGLRCASQIPLPILYRGHTVEAAYRIDLLVESEVIVEIKALEHLLPVHKAQLLSYLKMSGKRLGLLINFNTLHLRNGITRVANGAPELIEASAEDQA